MMNKPIENIQKIKNKLKLKTKAASVSAGDRLICFKSFNGLTPGQSYEVKTIVKLGSSGGIIVLNDLGLSWAYPYQAFNLE